MKNWKQRTFVAIIAVFSIIIGFISCDNGNDDGNGITNDENKYTVYIVGTYYNGFDDSQACYWKNGVRTDLPVESGRSSASSIVLLEGSMYITGNNYTASGNIPLYWKDGIKTELPVSDTIYNTAHYAGEIAIAEGSVYILGRDGFYYTEFYWKDDTIIEIPRDGYIYTTFDGGIAISDGSIYIAGAYQSQSGDPWKAAYWKDGVKTDLSVPAGSTSSYTRSIAMSGGSIYFVGNYNDGSKSIACYWKDGVKTDLAVPVGSTASIASVITVSNGSVYIAGRYNDGTKNIVCYWKDGIRTDTSVEGNTIPRAIVVLGGQIYLAGNYLEVVGGNGYDRAWYWKNGVKTDLNVAGFEYCAISNITVVIE
jgi:hypothetical protein